MGKLVILGAITGLIGAASADLHAFLTFKKDADLASFEWRVALLRWAAGAILGAVGAASLVSAAS